MTDPAKLGRYKLGKVLGKGAMGVVYEGLDPALNRRVAIKTILKNHAIDEDTARSYSERFAREAQAAGRLNHPHIVQVHDFAEEGDIAYLVMEFIQGRELRSYFEAQEKFDAAETVRIMGELLDALGFAHEAGVIHRDVKPANIMLDGQRRVKLADFGVARIQDSARSGADTMVGTPAFMSPEQISGRKIDQRTDLFSAGTILYQLLTGEQPFRGEGAWTVAKKIMQEDPPRPSQLVPGVPPAFDGIVKKALAKVPSQRFASAKEFSAALRDALSAGPQAAAAVAAPEAPAPKTKAEARTSDAEVEFWRAIQNSTDAAEFEFYLEQFPEATYSQLARHKVNKLREPNRSPARAAAETSAPEAANRVPAAADAHATVPIEPARAASTLPLANPGKRTALYPIAALVLIAGGLGAYLLLGRTPARAPEVASAPVMEVQKPAALPPKPEVSAADIEKIRQETEARIRREYAEKSAAEQAVLAKAAADKAVQEKLVAVKAAAEKAAAEKAAAEKAATEKAEKAAVARIAADRAAADKAAGEKAAADKAAAEKLAAEKAAADKAAREQIASAKARNTLEALRNKTFFALGSGSGAEWRADVTFKDAGPDVVISYERCVSCEQKFAFMQCRASISPALSWSGSCRGSGRAIESEVSGVFPNISIGGTVTSGNAELRLIDAALREKFTAARRSDPDLSTADFVKQGPAGGGAGAPR